MQKSDDLHDKLTGIGAVPAPTCPRVNGELRKLRGEVLDATKAAKSTEDEDAARALHTAADAIESAMNELDIEREVAGKLRAALEASQELAQTAITTVCDAEDLIAEQRTAIETQARVIEYLTDEVRKPWYRAIADTARMLIWKHRAKATAERNKALRWDFYDAHILLGDAREALDSARRVISAAAWTRVSHGRACSECRAVWLDEQRTPPPHEKWCETGEALREIREALRGWHPTK